MKKLKKLQNNKIKFKVVIFYGIPAVGKYTIAKEFHKQTGYKFFHNHDTHDLVRLFFERDTLGFDNLIEKLRKVIFEEISNAKINVVTTHAYFSDFISKSGLTDPAYLKKIESIIKKAGGEVYFIRLIAKESAVLKRVIGNSRKKFHKLKDPEIMKEILEKRRNSETKAPVKNNIEIDNTNLSPKQVVKKVREIIKV